MANTYVKIASATVGAGGASSIDFTSIPQTYTDLVLKISARGDNGIWGMLLSINGSAASFTNKYLEGTGAAATSGSLAQFIGEENATSATASTFGNSEVYLPNYTGSTNKSFSSDSVSENNATTAYTNLTANLWSNTAAITSLSLSIYNTSARKYSQYSTATLYGISKS
jgi:hypothetical protein